MRLFSVKTAVCVSLLSAVGAGWCWHQAQGLRTEANWLLERGRAHATEYTQSLDDAVATQELETFAKRRVVLERAHVWQRGQMLGVLVAVLALASAWVLSVLRRLTGELDEASRDLEPAPRAEPVPVRAAIRPSRS